jgi:hypothetical protein
MDRAKLVPLLVGVDAELRDPTLDRLEKQLQIIGHLTRGAPDHAKGSNTTSHHVTNLIGWLCSSDIFVFERIPIGKWFPLPVHNRRTELSIASLCFSANETVLELIALILMRNHPNFCHVVCSKT